MSRGALLIVAALAACTPDDASAPGSLVASTGAAPPSTTVTPAPVSTVATTTTNTTTVAAGVIADAAALATELSMIEAAIRAPEAPRSVLALRRLDGWFVIAATSDLATITVPGPMSVVAAGPVTVEGVAHGFEANVVVSAFVAGRHDTELAHQVTMAGN